MPDSVGFIGLGTMGGPMAANLAKAGVPLVVYDASPAAAAAAGQHAGVRVVGSPGEVAAHVSVLFTCLPNDAIVRAVYLAPGGIAAGGRPGLITCDCSTVSPEATLEVAAGVKARGIVHMDTPMLGSQPQAVSGEIFFIVGGDRDKLSAITPYLDIMGRLHMYVGPSATGNRGEAPAQRPRRRGRGWRSPRRSPPACSQASILTSSTRSCATAEAWRSGRTSTAACAGCSTATSRRPSPPS
jgi:3-hydroxyisobutyrate dehydrogenase-like beta-hydroxyacid dehydrogenase